MTGLLTPAGHCRNFANWDGSFGALEAARSQPQQPLPFGSFARTMCSPAWRSGISQGSGLVPNLRCLCLLQLPCSAG